MTKPAHNVFKGLKAQSLAAFSLFLQCLGQDDFEYIHLESDKGEDFDLVFKDGHKIICESKARKAAFGFSNLKDLLATVSKKRSIAQNDQILVVCTNANEKLENILSHFKYYPAPFIHEFTKRGFPQNLIDYLNQVRIWRVKPNYNQEIIYALFDELSQVWLPSDRMEELISHILWKKIFCKSASGSKYTRREFFSELNQFRQKLVKEGGILDREARKNEDVLKDLLKALTDDSHYVWKPTIISQLSTQPDLLYFVLDRIQSLNLKYNDLSKWATLWNLNKIAHFSFRIFKIFSANLHTPENRKYVLNYIKSHINQLRGFYRIDFFIAESSEMLDKILSADPALTKEAFSLIKDLFTCQEPASLFITQQKDQRYERDKIGGRLENVYKNADLDLKNEIYDYILKTFDLINEVGSSDIHTPSNLYSVVRSHLEANSGDEFKKRCLSLVKAFSSQYARDFKRFKMVFKGWESAGSTGSFWGNNYSVSDRKFVEVILKPALSRYYEKKPEEAWQFIKQHCITSQKKVSKTRPDFLNRTTIPVVLKRYKNGNKKVSQEALAVLKEFILSTKGIPVKFELIYQSIRSDDFTDEQKWELVQASLINKYGKIPITPFVEQIVTDLAKKNHSAARNTLKEWFKNPAYFKKNRIVDNAIPNIEAFLESDLTLAILLFEQFISNETFINKKDEFDTYDAAVVLQKILEKNYGKGLAILEKLLLIEKPTINQQILISHGFFHHRDPNDKGDTVALTRIFKNYVKPHLARFSDPTYLTHSHSRASFLQFARKLAISDLINEALIIVKAFIKDPDPYPPGKDPEDPEGKYNEQKRIEEKGECPSTITSVRGHTAWTLASFPAVPSRTFMPEIIQLTVRLLDDPNWYVKHMACFSLTNLARNRLSVMPPEKKTLFLDLNNNQEEALRTAKKIEEMSFKFLGEVAKASKNVQKALAESVLSPFGHIRSLNQNDAERILKLIEHATVPLREQFAPFLLYLAEFRGGSSVYQNWPWHVQGYYDDLREFDDSMFKKILEIWTVDGPAEIRAKLAWEYWALIQEAYKDQFENHFSIALKYLNLAAKKYEHGVFENIYRFIDDCIDARFDECFALWQKCLRTEKAFFDKDGFDPYKMHWWPHHYNGRILLLIKERLGDEEFLDWLEFLASYPEGSRLEDLRSAVELLVDLPPIHDSVIKKIFDCLINERKEQNYCDLKDAWEHKNTGATASP